MFLTALKILYVLATTCQADTQGGCRQTPRRFALGRWLELPPSARTRVPRVITQMIHR